MLLVKSLLLLAWTVNACDGLRVQDMFPTSSGRSESFPLLRGVISLPRRLREWWDLRRRATQQQTTAPTCVSPKLTCDPRAKYRTPDGYCNNLKHPAWGTPGWPFKRILAPAYDDGQNAPRAYGVSGRPLPSPRVVSRIVHTADSDNVLTDRLTSMFTHFGQFLDHDLDLTPLTNSDSELDCCEEMIQFPVRGFYTHPPTSSLAYLLKSRPLPGTCFPIPIPQPDGHFNSSCMNFVRSKVFAPSFKCKSSTREQGNGITSFIDASQVYGSSKAKQDSLRERVGGRLLSYKSDLLPSNSTTTCRSTSIPGKVCFGAGDTRVNEQPALSALHIVFHRYHNHLANFLSSRNILWDDETIFQEVRKIMGAILQHIVYKEYLPLLLGPHYMTAYELTPTLRHRYEPSTDPRIMNSFATAAFRFGHSMVPGNLIFGVKKQPLESAFFCPHLIQDDARKGLDDLIRGTLSDMSQGSDRYFSHTLSRNLFRNGGRSLDLVSLNIQRGRDHGLPPHNDFRKMCGLSRLSSSPEAPLLEVYEDMNDVDLFSGALTEEHVEGGVVGPTFACLIARQFRDLKFGDRFWYENPDPHTGFSRAQLRAIKKVSLASLLCTVTNLETVPKSPFETVSFRNRELSCTDVPSLDLGHWMNPVPL